MNLHSNRSKHIELVLNTYFSFFRDRVILRKSDIYKVKYLWNRTYNNKNNLLKYLMNINFIYIYSMTLQLSCSFQDIVKDIRNIIFALSHHKCFFFHFFAHTFPLMIYQFHFCYYFFFFT